MPTQPTADSGGGGASPRGHTNTNTNNSDNRRESRAESARRYRESQHFDNHDPNLPKLHLGNGGDNPHQIKAFTKLIEALANLIQTDATNFPENGKAIAEGFERDSLPTYTRPSTPVMPKKTDTQYYDAQNNFNRESFMTDLEIYKVDKLNYETELKEYKKKQKACEEASYRLYAKLKSQTSKELWERIKQQADFADADKDKDPIKLKSIIRKIMLGRTDAVEKYTGAIQSLVLFFTLYQGGGMALVQWRVALFKKLQSGSKSRDRE